MILLACLLYTISALEMINQAPFEFGVPVGSKAYFRYQEAKYTRVYGTPSSSCAGDQSGVPTNPRRVIPLLLLAHQTGDGSVAIASSQALQLARLASSIFKPYGIEFVPKYQTTSLPWPALYQHWLRTGAWPAANLPQDEEPQSGKEIENQCWAYCSAEQARCQAYSDEFTCECWNRAYSCLLWMCRDEPYRDQYKIAQEYMVQCPKTLCSDACEKFDDWEEPGEEEKISVLGSTSCFQVLQSCISIPLLSTSSFTEEERNCHCVEEYMACKIERTGSASTAGVRKTCAYYCPGERSGACLHEWADDTHSVDTSSLVGAGWATYGKTSSTAVHKNLLSERSLKVFFYDAEEASKYLFPASSLVTSRNVPVGLVGAIRFQVKGDPVPIRLLSIFIHEIGHSLGLFHTFHNNPNVLPAPCAYSYFEGGDFISDTAAVPKKVGSLNEDGSGCDDKGWKHFLCDPKAATMCLSLFYPGDGCSVIKKQLQCLQQFAGGGFRCAERAKKGKKTFIDLCLEKCPPSNCLSNIGGGSLKSPICPLDPAPFNSGPGNVMSYSTCALKYLHFTPQQAGRMRCVYDKLYADIYAPVLDLASGGLDDVETWSKYDKKIELSDDNSGHIWDLGTRVSISVPLNLFSSTATHLIMLIPSSMEDLGLEEWKNRFTITEIEGQLLEEEMEIVVPFSFLAGEQIQRGDYRLVMEGKMGGVLISDEINIGWRRCKPVPSSPSSVRADGVIFPVPKLAQGLCLPRRVCQSRLSSSKVVSAVGETCSEIEEGSEDVVCCAYKHAVDMTDTSLANEPSEDTVNLIMGNKEEFGIERSDLSFPFSIYAPAINCFIGSEVFFGWRLIDVPESEIPGKITTHLSSISDGSNSASDNKAIIPVDLFEDNKRAGVTIFRVPSTISPGAYVLELVSENMGSARSLPFEINHAPCDASFPSSGSCLESCDTEESGSSSGSSDGCFGLQSETGGSFQCCKNTYATGNFFFAGLDDSTEIFGLPVNMNLLIGVSGAVYLCCCALVSCFCVVTLKLRARKKRKSSGGGLGYLRSSSYSAMHTTRHSNRRSNRRASSRSSRRSYR